MGLELMNKKKPLAIEAFIIYVLFIPFSYPYLYKSLKPILRLSPKMYLQLPCL